MEVAESDLALRMDFGSRTDLGYEDSLFERNGFVEDARERRIANSAANAWDSSPVKHMPPVLRGQKTVKREEPWSKYHNDNIEELNAIDGVSVAEFYAISADRDNHVKVTLQQPEWDKSLKLGKKAYKPGGIEQMRAQQFRDARKAGTRAGSPPLLT